MALAPPHSLFLLSDSGQSSIVISSGSTFGVLAGEFSPLDSLSGVDWYFSAPSGFVLVSRESGWPFTDYLSDNPGLTSPQGAVLDDVNVSAGPGAYILGHFTLTAPANPGTYVLLPYTQTRQTGIVGSAPDFVEGGFEHVAGLSVVVAAPITPSVALPEPNILGLLLVVFFALRQLRRVRRCQLVRLG